MSEETGEVILTRNGCDFFVIETPGGCSLCESFGALVPEVDTMVSGEIAEFLTRNDIMNDERQQWLDDHRHFLDTGEIRRLELWEGE